MPALLILAAATSCIGLSVHDGDTIRCGAERIRIANIDAPELPGSPKCERRQGSRGWCDFALGFRSRDALRGLLGGRRVMIDRQGVDRYGRTLATVSINGVDAGEWLVSQGLARRWQ